MMRIALENGLSQKTVKEDVFLSQSHYLELPLKRSQQAYLLHFSPSFRHPHAGSRQLKSGFARPRRQPLLVMPQRADFL